MPTAILPKITTSAALTKTFASLATSSTNVGRQTTLVDNSTNRYDWIRVFVKLTQGTSPTGNRGANVWAIRSDKDATTPHRSDGAGASDAAFTALNAEPLGFMANKPSPSTGDVLYGEYLIEDPGPEWGVGVDHNTGVNLNSSESNHWVRWYGGYYEQQ